MREQENTLFERDYLEAFAEGAAVWLVRSRNPNLGALLNADQREYYIQILHRMLFFRREHELEPLNEDIYAAVKSAQEAISADEEYLLPVFNRHIDQLTEWGLIIKRLEKERLRDYKDERRDRFRYRLSDETVEFLYWLEDRLRHGDEERNEDAGELLDFLLERLRGLNRTLGRTDGTVDAEELARRAGNAFFLLHNANEYTERISRRLNELSATMESFLLQSYNVEEATELIEGLKQYLGSYVERIYNLRQKILAELERMRDTDNSAKLTNLFNIYAEDMRKAPRFMRRSVTVETPDKIISGLLEYYRRQGKIDVLCARVNSSAMKVWGKLSAHLRELERKNLRGEAICKRIEELSRLPEDAAPVDFFRELLSAAALPRDPNYWDEYVKAMPPQPRRVSVKTAEPPRSYISAKPPGGAPVQSLDESRLEKLKLWLGSKFPDKTLRNGVALEDGAYCGEADFLHLMDLFKRGLLGQGKSLKKIHLRLKTGHDVVKVADERRSLIFPATYIKEISDERKHRQT
ncbi:MAG: DUF2397 family protein [Victivallaceae bacterium]|nr:DUF2397 family protein [Victivallaceae bacterium]